MSKTHEQRMSAKKAVIDARIAKATEERGVTILLRGNGKGKSSSAFGTMMRSLGHGKKAAVVQFVKGRVETGEYKFFKDYPGLDWHVMGHGFTWETQDKETDIKAAQAAWQHSKMLLQDPSIDVVLLDEITYMLTYKYIDLDEVLEVLAARPKDQHVVITGRACHRAIIEIADTVSEVRSIKHAFDNGIQAQKGIDW